MGKKIALLQFDVAFADRAKNMRTVEGMFEKHITEDIDFVCMPETWDLGFYPTENLLDLADNEGRATKAFLSGLAAGYNVNIVGGSIIERFGDVFNNTAYIFDRKGNHIARYTKMHGSPTVRPANGEPFFKSGDEAVTFELDGITCGIIICYDIRFPELARGLALDGAQMIFVPAQWPRERIDHWRALTIARAIENVVYIAGVNASGGGGMIVGCGYSRLIDPWGVVIASRGEEDRAVIIEEVDFDKVEALRVHTGIYQNRKPEAYKRIFERGGD